MYNLQDAVSTLDSWVNRMVQFTRHPLSESKVIIALEGETDITLFNMVNQSETLHYDSPMSGKPDTIRGVARLKELVDNQVFGICDADFDVILNKTYDDILFTDKHDLEMMMIHDLFFHYFVYEHTNISVINQNDINEIKSNIYNNVLDVCYHIGIYKYINEKHNLNLNFKNYPYQNCTNVNFLSIFFDDDSFLELLLQRSDRSDYTTGQLMEKHAEYSAYGYDKEYIANGHDFCSIMALIYKQDLSKTKNINKESVESYLRSKYTQEIFSESNLFVQMKDFLGDLMPTSSTAEA